MCSPTAIQSLWPRSAEFGPWEGNRKALCKPHARGPASLVSAPQQSPHLTVQRNPVCTEACWVPSEPTLCRPPGIPKTGKPACCSCSHQAEAQARARQAPQVTPAPQLLPSSGGRGTGPCTPHSCSLPPCPICARAKWPGWTPAHKPTVNHFTPANVGPGPCFLTYKVRALKITLALHLPVLLPPGTWPSEGTGSPK